MGTGAWVKEGSQDTAEVYLNNKVQHPQLYLGLFTNVIPALNLRDATLATVVEPTAITYARVPMSPVNWVIYGDVSIYPDIEFEVSLEGLGTIYGCFITTSPDSAGDVAGRLLAINNFTVPAVLVQYGDRIRITPKLTIT
jgi:hypothetical protein